VGLPNGYFYFKVMEFPEWTSHAGTLSKGLSS